ncbi:MAG: DUF4290 domain-containing protein [Saprospiraceae bacterium]|jgi:uncharacterized membrane protein YgcG|nr:DUF4290 domain-containing protein [Saprospiraceae bacterium]
MEYNSQKEELIIPEYGRNVQAMIRYAREVPDRNMRQQYIEQIVMLMMQMHPQNRNMEDHRDKTWKHVFRIAEYNLDVMPPNGEIPKPEDSRKRPEKVPYPIRETKFRHYGHNVQKLVARALQMEDGAKKEGFVQVIGSYMKLAYKTWNREHYVSDDIIIEDLEHLSGGKLKVMDDASLDNLSRGNIRRPGDNRDRERERDRGGRNRGGGGGRPGGKDNRRGGSGGGGSQQRRSGGGGGNGRRK